MIKTVILEDLDCAHCAAKIEEMVKKLQGVENCSVNFLTQKMVINAADEEMNNVIKSAKDIVKKLEPDVTFKLI